MKQLSFLVAAITVATFLFATKPVQAQQQDDLWLLAHLIAGEAQNCDDDEQMKVGSVVLNRVASNKFPNNIHDVIYQPHQYGCVSDGNFYREPTKDNWLNAEWLLKHGSALPPNVLYQGYNTGKLYVKTRYHIYCY